MRQQQGVTPGLPGSWSRAQERRPEWLAGRPPQPCWALAVPQVTGDIYILERSSTYTLEPGGRGGREAAGSLSLALSPEPGARRVGEPEYIEGTQPPKLSLPRCVPGGEGRNWPQRPWEFCSCSRWLVSTLVYPSAPCLRSLLGGCLSPDLCPDWWGMAAQVPKSQPETDGGLVLASGPTQFRGSSVAPGPLAWAASVLCPGPSSHSPASAANPWQGPAAGPSHGR